MKLILNASEHVDLQLAIALARDTAKNNSLLCYYDDNYWEKRRSAYDALLQKVKGFYLETFT